MRLLNIIRSNEWWEFKLPPLLAIGYATALKSNISLYSTAQLFLFLLASLMIGAIYVSIINDITDIEEDLASGKTNRMASISPKIRWLFPVTCVLSWIFFLYCMRKDYLSIILYTLPWIAFSLYSFKPFRLKKRGVWGVLADAFGSHVFISLLMVSSTSYFTKQAIDWIWFSAVGLWATAYGLRGILWHQFLDRENDIKVNLNTFASQIDPASFKIPTVVLMLMELLALIVMLWCISLPLTLVFLVFYFILIFIRQNRFNNKIIMIMTPLNLNFQIFMSDYYQLFLPLSLLITAAMHHSFDWIILIVHLILFPRKIYQIVKEISC